MKYAYLAEKGELNCIENVDDVDTLFGEQHFIKLRSPSDGYINLPKMASKFVVDDDNTRVSVAFSAMSIVWGTENEPLQVRILIDGHEAEPGPIVFTANTGSVNPPASQSFVFLANVDEGIHTVNVQYSTEDMGNVSAYIRNASLRINTDTPKIAGDGLAGKASRTGITKNDGGWSAIPDTEQTIYIPEGSETTIAFSSVLKMLAGDFIIVRAVIDDGTVKAFPESISMTARMYFTEARSATFNTANIPPGEHRLRMEWRASITEDVVASATMYYWSLVVQSARKKSDDGAFAVVSQAILVTTGDSTFEPIANLSTNVDVAEVADIAVTFSGSVGGFGNTFVSLTIDGEPDIEQQALLYSPSITCVAGTTNCQANKGGVRSYTFAIKSLPRREQPYNIGVAYRTTQAGVLTAPSAIIFDANLVVQKKTRVGPDLAVGANMGAGSSKYRATIEPIYGSRPVLTLMIDPGFLDFPAGPNFRVFTDDVLYNGVQNVSDYFDVVSGGRFTIDRAATLGPYDASSDTDYYEDDDNFDCEAGAVYKSAGDLLHAKALLVAAGVFDFSQYDTNRDGKLDPSELGIIVALPRDSTARSGVSGNPYCESQPWMVDGVEITKVVHLNLIHKQAVPSPEDKTGNLIVAAHELGHLLLGLDDLYGTHAWMFDGATYTPIDKCPKPQDIPAGMTCTTRTLNTTPANISLMAESIQDTTAHINAFHKLHLGWVRPWILETEQAYELTDVKDSKTVFILPRRKHDGSEYVLLESRFNEKDMLSPKYDYNIIDSGMAVYHVVEPNDACTSPQGAAAPDCTALIPPMCISPMVWNRHFSNFARVGLRLVQPDLVHKYHQTDGTLYTRTMFPGSFGQSLLDTGEQICPDFIGEELPDGGSPLLLWADGLPSGYRLNTILNKIPDKSVEFDLEID